MSKIRENEPEGFDRFWQLWKPNMRHTDGKSDARKGYIKAILRGAMPEDIFDGAQGYIRFMPEKDRPYIQLAETFLNKERYDDWCDRERDYQRRMAERETNVVQMVRAAPLPANHFLNTYKAKQEQR